MSSHGNSTLGGLIGSLSSHGLSSLSLASFSGHGNSQTNGQESLPSILIDVGFDEEIEEGELEAARAEAKATGHNLVR